MNLQVFARESHHARHGKAIADKFELPVESDIGNITADYVVVFSYRDLKLVDDLGKKIIFCDHGTGLFYNEPHPSYAGSDLKRENVVLRLSPNKAHAKKETETITCPIEVIGIPKLDRYAKKGYRIRKGTPRVAISFHFDCKVNPETRSGFGYFKDILPILKHNFITYGHGHPRLIDLIEHHYRANAIPIKKDFYNEVLEKVDCYICDNSSTIWEFLITKKPVVLLTPPFYRKDIEHEGNPRFWKYANIGPEVTDPTKIVEAVNDAINNHEKYLPAILEAREEVLGFTDGECAERAYQAIIKHLGKEIYENI